MKVLALDIALALVAVVSVVAACDTRTTTEGTTCLANRYNECTHAPPAYDCVETAYLLCRLPLPPLLDKTPRAPVDVTAEAE